MAGETILVVDDSVAVQDIATRVLEGAGYRVVTTSNGVAALSYPELNGIDLAVVDSSMDGINGEETVNRLRGSESTHQMPVLLLAPESEKEDRASQPLFGANGYLIKPFEPKHLVKKVKSLIDERNIEREAARHVQAAADLKMKSIAEDHIQTAIEKRTQIIAERAIQNVVAMVDQHARREIETKITSLSAEKEQELVRVTVREVAQSMVEKLAERKVNEAMEKILQEETARAVKKSADQQLPTIVRERLRDAINNTLPREVENRVRREIEGQIPIVAQQVVQMVEGVAQQAVPKVARERVPEIAERQIKSLNEERIPRMVRDLVERELSAQVTQKISPMINDSRATLDRKVRNTALIAFGMLAVLLIGNIVLFYLNHFGSKQ